jgi:predicted RNase H-like HicB family nuclease
MSNSPSYRYNQVSVGNDRYASSFTRTMHEAEPDQPKTTSTDMKMRYLVIIEQGPDAFGAYVPDMPGCIAAGETRAEALRQIRRAIQSRIDTLHNDNRSIPHPKSTVEVVDVKFPDS